MPRLAFRPDADGFAFQNSFTFDAAERAVLASQGFAVAGAVGALGLPPYFVAIASVAAAGYLGFGPLPGYGLCGGMCYTSLDYWRAKVPLPRGSDKNDEPIRGTTGGGPVRDLLWSRLLASLKSGGALAGTLEWMLRLNCLPGITGGASWLKAQTEQEWARLHSHIDNGEPWPIALVGRTLSMWDQHQVLVYGYTLTGGINLLVYDCNAPHQEGTMEDTVLTVDFSLASHAVISGPSLTKEIGEVVGFFCTSYTPEPADPALAVDYGLYVNQAGTLDKMAWGARLPIATAQELTSVGGNPTTVRTDPNPTGSPSGTGFPRDGVLLQDRTQPAAMLFQGGALFPVTSQVALNFFGGPSAVQLAPAGSLQRFTQPPADGTLLREISQAAVFVIQQGQKCWITSPGELEKWGGYPSVRLVPDGALSDLPDGPNLPQPLPGQCDTIKQQIASLEAAIVVLQASVDELDDEGNPRAAAPIKHHIEIDKQAIQSLQELSQELGCP